MNEDITNKNYPLSWNYFSVFFTGLVIFLPIILVIIIGGDWRAFFWGAISWILALALKLTISIFFNDIISDFSDITISSFYGFVSAISELGFSVLFVFLFGYYSIGEIISLGVGVATIENTYLFLISLLPSSSKKEDIDQWIDMSYKSLCVRFFFSIERLSATLGHIGSRGIISLSLIVSYPFNYLSAILSILLFSVVDAYAVYGDLKKWNWLERCSFSNYLFLTIGTIELILFMMLYFYT